MSATSFALAVCLGAASSRLIPQPGEVVTGRGYAAPPNQGALHPQHAALPPYHTAPPLASQKVARQSKGFSQFDQPGSFQPVPQPYSSRNLGPAPEQGLVSGPPLGDDLLDRYQRYLAGLEAGHQKDSQGLTQIKPRRKERNLRPQDTLLSYRPDVKLDFASVLDSGRPSDSHFSPNSKWQGERETRLLQLPKVTGNTSPQVDLEFVSPTAGRETFSPNGRWFGDKEKGLLENRQNLVHRNRPEVVLTHPSSSAEGISTSFSPSSRWLQQRELALDQPRTSSLSEPQVITLENLSSFLGPNNFPDSFSVDVKTVLRTRGASPGPVV